MYDGGEHNPKLMPCSHTVCIQCLDRIVATFARDTGQFRCPICRELITIPRGGVQALPPSFLVNQLLDLMARQRREVIPKCSTHHNQVNLRFEFYCEFSIRDKWNIWRFNYSWYCSTFTSLIGITILWDMWYGVLYIMYRRNPWTITK